VQVPKRSSSKTIQAKGIYPGAKVARGPDWAAKYGDQDGENSLNYKPISNWGLAMGLTVKAKPSKCHI